MTTSINQHFSPWSLLKFAFPSIIMMMFMSLYTIVDGIFVSRFVGSNALSSLNIAFPAASVVIAVGTMLATGGTAVISKYLGEGKKKRGTGMPLSVSFSRTVIQLFRRFDRCSLSRTDLPDAWCKRPASG